MQQALLRNYEQQSNIQERQPPAEHIDNLFHYAKLFNSNFRDYQRNQRNKIAYYACLNCIETIGDIFHQLEQRDFQKTGEKDPGTGRDIVIKVSNIFDPFRDNMQHDGILVNTFLRYRATISHLFKTIPLADLIVLGHSINLLINDINIVRYKKIYSELVNPPKRQPREKMEKRPLPGQAAGFLPRSVRARRQEKHDSLGVEQPVIAARAESRESTLSVEGVTHTEIRDTLDRNEPSSSQASLLSASLAIFGTPPSSLPSTPADGTESPPKMGINQER